MTAPPMVSASVVDSARLRMRAAGPADLEGIVETQADEEVRRFMGGPRDADAVRDFLTTAGVEKVTASPGSFIVADRVSDEMLGTIILSRRSAELPGHVAAGGNELEVAYLFRRHAWGRGYATEAVGAILRAAADELVDQPVLIVTQAANTASLRLAGRLGFHVVTTFEHFDAEQTLAVVTLHDFRSE